MKFENITSTKFKPFREYEVKNLNTIVGGAVFTNNTKAGTHDEGSVTKGGWELDDVITSSHGTTIGSDSDPD